MTEQQLGSLTLALLSTNSAELWKRRLRPCWRHTLFPRS